MTTRVQAVPLIAMIAMTAMTAMTAITTMTATILMAFTEPGRPAGPARVLVVCSPGSPGTTQQAQATMDAFAQAVARAAGREAGALAAVYYETADAGLGRLAQEDAALAMVPLPFLVRYAAELSLKPRLEAVQESGEPEVWTLVAKKGRVASPASLDGWEVTGTPGYAERFVRGVLMSGWGALPAGAKITFGARPLGALRRAASGERVAIVLDKEQTTALGSLPFGSDLEQVARSSPLPSGFVCTIGRRLPESEAGALIKALLHLHETDSGRDLLRSMKMTRFKEPDQAALERIRRQAAVSE